MVDFVINAQDRADKGKGASRRLRRLANRVPAIVYGGKKDPRSISLDQDDMKQSVENEAFFSHIITINLEGGDKEEVIVKDVQRHPAKHLVTHMDFLRIDKTQKLQTRVPLHFLNEETCPGVKQENGIVSHALTDLEIQCLPGDLPEYIEIDMAEMNMGDTLHISDIKLPEGVESVDLLHGEDYDHPVAAIIKPRGAVEEEAAEEEEAPGEPEEEEKGEQTDEEAGEEGEE